MSSFVGMEIAAVRQLAMQLGAKADEIDQLAAQLTQPTFPGPCARPVMRRPEMRTSRTRPRRRRALRAGAWVMPSKVIGTTHAHSSFMVRKAARSQRTPRMLRFMARVGQGRVRDTRWLVSCDGSQRSGKLNTIYCVDQDFSRCKSRLWTAAPGWG